jgi:hypothetical protein
VNLVRMSDNLAHSGKVTALEVFVTAMRSTRRRFLVLTGTPNTLLLITSIFKACGLAWRQVQCPFEPVSDAFLVCECARAIDIDWCPLAVHALVSFTPLVSPMARFRPSDDSKWQREIDIVRLATLPMYETAALANAAATVPPGAARRRHLRCRDAPLAVANP